MTRLVWVFGTLFGLVWFGLLSWGVPGIRIAFLMRTKPNGSGSLIVVFLSDMFWVCCWLLFLFWIFFLRKGEHLAV
ncbi:hypothetical protein QBC44DRAFT_334365 [Cladorrhinum sp. PSN332]|nr:hypothetical protein QBC44DRAFT_334365 [Cladorrhinum sp. PSN332]